MKICNLPVQCPWMNWGCWEMLRIRSLQPAWRSAVFALSLCPGNHHNGGNHQSWENSFIPSIARRIDTNWVDWIERPGDSQEYPLVLRESSGRRWYCFRPVETFASLLPEEMNGKTRCSSMSSMSEFLFPYLFATIHRLNMLAGGEIIHRLHRGISNEKVRSNEWIFIAESLRSIFEDGIQYRCLLFPVNKDQRWPTTCCWIGCVRFEAFQDLEQRTELRGGVLIN